MNHLPVDDILPELVRTLRTHPWVVLQAPPGAGKSTRVPGALVDAGFAETGQVWMLEPRRVAARTVAARVASERGGRLGDEVGYAVRFDRKASASTRLLVVTEGLLVRKLQQDPFLEGISCVILDEFHERSIEIDLCIAMLKEVVQVRDDLRVVVMSATLQAAELSSYLDAPVVQSKGRMFPVESRFLDRPEDDVVAAAITATARALKEDDGDVLVFMPGKREIEQTLRGLASRTNGVRLLPLHGGLTLQEQVEAIEPSKHQRVIVSTNIAETSLTVEGVTCVVDSGLVKQLIASDAGLDALVTRRISQASAVQRAGRAGRTQPGRVHKLWSRPQDQFLEDFDLPAIARVDITHAVLQVLAWSSADPRDFDWFEAPSAQSLERVITWLRSVGALAPTGWSLSPRGQALTDLPTHPRLGQLILEGIALGVRKEAVRAAAMLSEGQQPAIRRARVQCEVWEGMQTMSERDPMFKRAVNQLGRMAQDIERAHPTPRVTHEGSAQDRLCRALMRAYPDRVSMQRDPHSDNYLMGGHQSVKLARESKLERAPWMVAVVLHGHTRTKGDVERALVRTASVCEQRWLEHDMPHLWTQVVQVEFDEERARVVAQQHVQCMGATVRSSVVSVRDHADPQDVTTKLARAASKDLHRALKPDKETLQLLERVAFLAQWMPDLELPVLQRHPPEEGRGEATESMLEQWCWGKRAFDELRKASIKGLLRQGLTHAQWSALQAHAPATYKIPSGSNVHIDYSDPQSPVLGARIQELFGLMKTPELAQGRVPLTMHLLGPNYRPAQVTQDLQSFWHNTYADVRKELRSRYPKHHWPEDPLTATATSRGGRRPR